MRKLVVAVSVSGLLAAGLAGAASADPSCWGQATKVFAGTGVMGEHASSEPTPRLGLRNLARALAADGAIPDDSMASLGAFVADTLGLSVDACTS